MLPNQGGTVWNVDFLAPVAVIVRRWGGGFYLSLLRVVVVFSLHYSPLQMYGYMEVLLMKGYEKYTPFGRITQITQREWPDKLIEKAKPAASLSVH